jgi:SAM-dependent methyltransferase
MALFGNIYEPFQRRFRPRRLRLFYSLLDISPKTRVLDLGGGAFFWDLALSEGLPLPQVTVLNTRPAGSQARNYLTWVLGDARYTNFGDQSFDVVFSNSLIEHLGDWDSQMQFANEVRRLAPRYFVQTPDRHFPVEPHLVTPFIHWLPKSMQRPMIRNFTVWGLLKRPSQSYCEVLWKELALLSAKQMMILFPDSRFVIERFLTLPKSIIAIRTSGQETDSRPKVQFQKKGVISTDECLDLEPRVK